MKSLLLEHHRRAVLLLNSESLMPLLYSSDFWAVRFLQSFDFLACPWFFSSLAFKVKFICGGKRERNEYHVVIGFTMSAFRVDIII